MTWKQNQFPTSGTATLDLITIILTEGWINQEV